MKRLSVIVALSGILLASCSGSGSSATACTKQYWDGAVGMCLVNGWSVMDRDTLAQRGVSEDVVVGFQSSATVSGQIPTIVVTKEDLSQVMDSQAYSDASVRAVAALPGYNVIDQRNITIDGHPTKLHIFSVQPSANDPARRFYQLNAASGNTGYAYTAVTPLSVADTLDKQIITMLNSATFTAPKK